MVNLFSKHSLNLVLGIFGVAILALLMPFQLASAQTTNTSSQTSSESSASASLTPVASPTPGKAKRLGFDDKSGANKDFGKLPTYIKSLTLTIKNDERIFEYAGQVEVTQGDMTLTSDFLDGKYNQQNQIEQLVARSNVTIVKGDKIRATGQRAIYEAATGLLTLTESPELQQNDSILTGDVIKVFMNENRSVAEGAVRVKLVKKDAGSGTSPQNFFMGK